MEEMKSDHHHGKAYINGLIINALMDVLVDDVISVILKFSKQEKVLLIAGNLHDGTQIQERGTSSIILYDPSADEWTINSKVQHPNVIVQQVDACIWEDHTLIVMEANYKADEVDYEQTILNIETGALVTRFGQQFKDIPVLVERRDNLFGLVHSTHLSSGKYLYSYDVLSGQWIQSVKKLPARMNYDLFYFSECKGGRLFGQYVGLDLLFEYEVETNVWKEIQRLPSPFLTSSYYCISIPYHQYIYTVGGDDGGNQCVKYDLLHNKWSTFASLPHGHSRFNRLLTIADHSLFICIDGVQKGPYLMSYHLNQADDSGTWNMVRPIPEQHPDLSQFVIAVCLTV